MHHPTDRITHTTAFVTPVVEHWLEREIAQWVRSMKDLSDDPLHHERTLLPRSYISPQIVSELIFILKRAIEDLLIVSFRVLHVVLYLNLVERRSVRLNGETRMNDGVSRGSYSLPGRHYTSLKPRTHSFVRDNIFIVTINYFLFHPILGDYLSLHGTLVCDDGIT